MDINNLLNKLTVENKKIISRTISIIEYGNSDSIDILKTIYQKTGNAYRIGITGPPGAGKSTITNQLTKHIRNQNKTVAVIAVDPTSPFTGGALLGDRIRMSDLSGDKGVFIRSMATRGSLGGLSKKTIDAADVLDAAGYDYILFETVGVGQSELDIARTADTTVVVLVPESGDSIQAMKAGLMEIADMFVMNKSDRPSSDSAITAVQMILNFKQYDKDKWVPKIIKSIASENKGIIDIVNAIGDHKKYLEEKDLLQKKRQNNSRLRIKGIVEAFLKEEFWNKDRETSLNNSLGKVVLGQLSPYFLAEELINHYKNNNND